MSETLLLWSPVILQALVGLFFVGVVYQKIVQHTKELDELKVGKVDKAVLSVEMARIDSDLVNMGRRTKRLEEK